MAVLTLYHFLPAGQTLVGLVTIADSGHIQLVAGPVTIDYYGSGFAFSDQPSVIAGTVSGYELRNSAAGGLQFSVTGLNLAAVPFFNLAISGDAAALAALVFAGNDTLQGSPEADFLQGHGGSDAVTGGGGDDILVGDDDAAVDTLEGGAGNDLYFVGGTGHASNDIVIEQDNGGIDAVESLTSYTLGAHLEDLYLAGPGPSNGAGNAVDNLIVGNSGANVLDGLAGHDTLDGGSGGADTLRGGDGNDRYTVDHAGVSIWELAGGGTDSVVASIHYTLPDHVEHLTLAGLALQGSGNALANQVTGAAGNDTLDGGAGADTLDGGLGDDHYLVDNLGDLVTDAGGIDTIVSTFISYVLSAADIENLTLAGAALAGTGNAGANLLVGNALDNSLFGLGGDDTLQGGSGSDTLAGGAGNDLYIVDSTGDVVTEQAGGGTDRVQASISWQLGAELENLALDGVSGLSGSGNTLGNQITGTAGNDTLDGGGGADTLMGGAGGDSYLVDHAGDLVADDGPSGDTDTVFAALGYDMAAAAQVENLVLSGSGNTSGSGNDLPNRITGNSGNNTLIAVYFGDTLDGGLGNDSLVGTGWSELLDGGGGIDTLAGGAGFDTYVVDHPADVIIETEAIGFNENDLVQAWVSYTLTSEVEWLTLMGDQPIDGTGTAATNETITGNSAANRIHSGGGANDDLYGMGGDDTLDAGGNHARLFGGTGNDTYIVGGSLPFIVEAAGEGTDTVVASNSLTLPAHFENLSLLSGLEANGNDLSNVINGSPEANFIDGHGGADTMSGGFGDDQYYVDNAGDVVVEFDGQGYDSVVADGVSVSIAHVSVERIYLGDNTNANTDATGNALDNFIRGTNGHNVLDGGAGADEMYAWLGDDTYVVDNAGDQIFEFDGQGTDTVRSTLAGFTLAEHFEILVLAQGAVSGTGNAASNTLSGNDSANSLDGAGGHDTLAGGKGNDSLAGGAGNDLLDGDAGVDRAGYLGARSGYTVTRNTAAGTVTVSGSEGTDILVGIDEIAFGDQLMTLNVHQASGNVAVSGILMENRLLTASASALADADGTGAGTLGWQWFRGDAAIPGATSATYLTGAADVGASLRARTRFVDGAGNTETLWSAATAAIALGDHIAPAVLEFSPAHEATGVALAAHFVLTFDEAIARGAGLVALRTADGQLVESFDAATSGHLAFSGSTVTVDPAATLAYATHYRLEFAAGTVLDLEGNPWGGTTSYSFGSRSGESVGGSAAAEALGGTAGHDSIAGQAGNDTLTGGAGDDSLDGGEGTDSAVFTGTRASHTVTRTAGGATVTDGVAGRNGTDTAVDVEMLLFSDRSVDLALKARAAEIAPATLKTMQELYVGFFNRIPEADGLAYWVDALRGGASLEDIANQFYAAGVTFGVYSADFSDSQFVAQVYDYVLARGPHSANPPPAADIQYWADQLATGTETEGTLVLQMLSDVHTFFEDLPPGDPNFQFNFVADLLNNKAAVAHYYAVELGLSMYTAAQNIQFGSDLVDLITPDGTGAALALIGIDSN